MLVFERNTGIHTEIIYTVEPHLDIYDTLLAHLVSLKVVEYPYLFDKIARKMNLPDHIQSGTYTIQRHMPYVLIIRMFRSGLINTSDLVISSARTKADLSKKVSQYIVADSGSIHKLLDDSVYLSSIGLNRHSVMAIMIPNTYELYSNATAKDFLARMQRENKHFWHEDRMRKARQIGLSPHEVITLASIVQEEYSKVEERGKIARVYLNRLEKGMKLQADPTLKFASGKFAEKRVRNKFKKIKSPYNTYLYSGLPPGPICIPQISTIDAVLEAPKHNYFFFCAKEDLSGWHHFSETYKEHKHYAKLYRLSLDKRKIF